MSVVFFSLNYLTGFALFFIILNTIKSEEFVIKIVKVLCLSTFLSLCFGLYQHLKNMELGNNPISLSQGLINATFKDSLSFAAYIAIIVPLVLGAFFYFGWKGKILTFIITMLAFYMIFFTGSKSGLICLVISLSCFLGLSLKIAFDLIKSKSISQKRALVSSLIIFFFIGATIPAFIFLKDNIASSRTLVRLNPLLKQGLKNFLASERFSLWKIAGYTIRDYPLTGLGIGGYIIEAANYAKEHQVYIGVPQSAENYFLQVGAELGMLSLILILWIFLEIIRQMRLSYLRIPSSGKNKFILIGAIAGVIAYFINIQAHTYIGSYEIKYTFWLLVALIFCLARDGNEHEEHKERFLFNKRFKIFSIALIFLFSGVLLWNSTHSLSLKSRTEQFGLKQDFGFYQPEKTNDGREFRWTRSYGGLTLKIEKPVIAIPLVASHPDIQQNPVKVKIYIVKDFFKHKKLLDEVSLTQSIWKNYEYDVPQEVGKEVILLVKVNRTWNPLKTFGTPDPRNLGVAMGKVEFRDKLVP